VRQTGRVLMVANASPTQEPTASPTAFRTSDEDGQLEQVAHREARESPELSSCLVPTHRQGKVAERNQGRGSSCSTRLSKIRAVRVGFDSDEQFHFTLTYAARDISYANAVQPESTGHSICSNLR